VGRPVSLFAYPCGVPGSYERRAVHIGRPAGYTRVCTTPHADPLTRLTGRYRVPRNSGLARDEGEFGRHFRHWLDE
jgi:hypothetical protein